MTITTYSDLLSEVADHVDGATFDGATLVALAEADFRRQIIATEQETSITFDTATPIVPDDFDSIRSLTVAGQGPITVVDPASYAALPLPYAGAPRYYMLSNGSLAIWPTPDQSYTATLLYRQGIPALSDDNPVNWLLTAHPDLYLYATVSRAELYGWNDPRAATFAQAAQSIIDAINTAAQRRRYGGPLVMRPSVTEGTGLRRRYVFAH